MNFHWFLLISIDFHWILMIFIDSWWIPNLLRWSGRPARPQCAASAAPDAQTHVSACPSGPSDHSIHRANDLRHYNGTEATTRCHVKKSIAFFYEKEDRKKKKTICSKIQKNNSTPSPGFARPSNDLRPLSRRAAVCDCKENFVPAPVPRLRVA